jgi:large subunit ribosomal protein L10
MPALIKQLMLDEVKKAVAKSLALILVDSSKLKAGDAISFRSKLRKAGAGLKVTKASLLYRCLPEGADKTIPAKGSVGVVVVTGDIAASAKLVNELVKEEKLVLKGAILEGKAIDAKGAVKLADLPTRDQANAMLVRVLNSPLVQLVRIANVKPTELVRVLKVASDEKSKN